MNELPAYWAKILRTATNDCARVFARRQLATSIHRLAGDKLRAEGVPPDVADFEANHLAYDLGRRIEAGLINPGSEDAYVRSSARHRAADHYREKSGVRARCELHKDHEELADSRNPERLLSDSQEAEATERQVLRLRALISTAPAMYRDILYEVHVDGTLIEVLVRREVDARIARGAERVADAAALRRARATIDQRLHRAREWVREQMGIAPLRRAR